MIKIFHYITLCLSAVLLFTFSGCHSHKSATEVPDTEIVTATEWQDLYVPVTFELQSPKSMSISGRATMIRDRRIHISLRILGMEVALIDITPENITAIDKYHKVIVTEPIEKLLADQKLTISDLQDALIGQASDDVMRRLDATALAVEFGPLVNAPEGSLTRYVNVSASLSGKPILLNLRYKPEQAKWNTGRTVSYRIPTDYRQIDARALIENFKNE